MSIYLDYNASTPIDTRVLETMNFVYMNRFGNASSRTHEHGQKANHEVEDARKKVASLLGVESHEVIFTSGATESDNIAIMGLQKYGEASGRKHIITSAIEHKAVLECVKYLGDMGFDVEFIRPSSDGRITAESVLSRVREDTLLVSVQHVNNETGIIQPVGEIGHALAKSNTLFHIDAVQACGKLVDEIQSLQYNMMSISAHKMYGPQGIGGLIVRKNKGKRLPVRPIMYGGGQEDGLRPGTLPVALIAGFGTACEIAKQEYQQNDIKAIQNKQAILEVINTSKIDYIINGDQNYCINNTLNISFPGIDSEALMIATKQYCSISNGSACTSNDYSPSYVLIAMGLPNAQIESAIRMSWGTAPVDTNMLCRMASFINGIQ